MLDPQNLITISGGLVDEPELVASGKIAKMRLAVDYAGSEKDGNNNSGYFDVTYYLKDNNGFSSKNASFIAGQIDQSKMKKGTSVTVVGRLVQERWKQDDQSRSRIVIVAEHMTYAARSGSSKSNDSSSSSSTSNTESAAAATVPTSF